MIIGLTGRKRSGKSTAARYLVENHGFTELSFAAPLKKMALDIDPLVEVVDPDSRRGYTLCEALPQVREVMTYCGDVHLAPLVDAIGWEQAKDQFPEVRRFLQRLGTDGVRNNLGDRIWVNLVEDQIDELWTNDFKNNRPNRPIVIADVRFENEADLICREGGIVIEVVRPGIPAAADTHASEAGVDPDYQVTNHEDHPDQMFGFLSGRMGLLSA